MASFASKYLPLIILLLNTVGAAVSPALGGFWAAHPVVASLISAVALFFPQPHK